jgi:hypothetical protein
VEAKNPAYADDTRDLIALDGFIEGFTVDAEE